MTSTIPPDQNYFPHDFGPMIETAQVAGLTLIANALIAFDRLRRDPKMRRPVAAVVTAAHALLADLLPCPFCGGEAAVREVPMGIGDSRFRISCTRCAATVTDKPTATAGIAMVRWNTRAQPTPAAARKDGEPARGLLLELFANAYNEGFGEGMRDHTSSKGGWPWSARKQKYSALLDRAFAAPPAVAPEPVGDGVREAIIEGIIFRRLHEKRIDGYTIEIAKEIAAAIADRPATERGK